MALSDFEKLVTIAKGSFGTVYKAVRKDNGRVYALKQVEIANMNRAEREEAVDEVRALDARRVNATRQPKLFRETRLAFSVPKPPCPRRWSRSLRRCAGVRSRTICGPSPDGARRLLSQSTTSRLARRTASPFCSYTASAPPASTGGGA